jgi:hypothetical protein
MLDAQIELALGVARETWRDAVPVRMTNVKVRSFTPPGTRLTLGADVRERGEREATFNLSAHADGKAVATARVAIARTEAPLAAPRGGAASPSARPCGTGGPQ